MRRFELQDFGNAHGPTAADAVDPRKDWPKVSARVCHRTCAGGSIRAVPPHPADISPGEGPGPGCTGRAETQD